MKMEQTITYILLSAAFYGSAGVLFSLVFIRKGLIKTDPSAKGSSPVFKLLIFPGLVIFWPLFFKKWIKAHHT